MQLEAIQLSYYKNGSYKEVFFKDLKSYNHEDFEIRPVVKYQEIGQTLTIDIHPVTEIVIENFKLHYHLVLKDKKMMVNGFQTWTQSKEMTCSNRLKKLSFIGKLFTLEPYGDYFLHKYTGKKGCFHSYTYTSIKDEGYNCLFLGSIDETSGYTIFEGDYETGKLTITKECKGLVMGSPRQMLHLYIGKGDEKDLWNRYFSFMPSTRGSVKKCTGWTSWYNYYTKISEKIILKNLSAMEKEKIPLDVFQIDDGYQEAVGDWLLINDKFPSGMGILADKIKEAGYKPGIWLAPFVCEKKSTLFEEHGEWLLRDEVGNLVKAGWNPGWSGTFYVLDFYNPGFRDYLRRVFDTILNKWGYQMVKLDFLYAVAILPRLNKTRGLIMDEAMTFLADLIGEKWILGCGVPLGPTFKKVDYCRVGSDVAPYWEDKKLKLLGYRERVSTVNSLYSTLGRYQLNGRAFYSDPDVFMLRKENNQLTPNQKHTLFTLNNLLGGLVFLSDDITHYDYEEMTLFKSMFPSMETIIEGITEKAQVYEVDFSIGEKKYCVQSNLSNKRVKVQLEDGFYYNKKDFIIKGGHLITLEAHQTKVYLKINEIQGISFIGSTGHVFSGGEIEKVEVEANKISLKLNEKFIGRTTVFFRTDNLGDCLYVNGRKHTSELIEGYPIVKVNY